MCGFSLPLLCGGSLAPWGMRNHMEQRPALPTGSLQPARPPTAKPERRPYQILSLLVGLLADHRHIRETSREQPATERNSPADPHDRELDSMDCFKPPKVDVC